jgi:hypothetical protein
MFDMEEPLRLHAIVALLAMIFPVFYVLLKFKSNILRKEAVFFACGDLGDAGCDELDVVPLDSCVAEAELAFVVVAHSLKAAVGLDEEAVFFASGDLGDVRVDLEGGGFL